MASFAMQLGRRYPTPLFWNNTREHKVFGPYILQEVERQVCVVRMNLRIARSRQKSNADLRRRGLNFEDFVYLKVSPMRGLRCFMVRVELAPRFIGSFKITEKREDKFKAELLKFLF
jgi:hypothetical protein